jgi:hypothetical protein
MKRRLSSLDRDALERCLALARQEDPARAEQLDDFLRERPWFEVADFACYVVQMRSLHLRPWELPPSSADVCGDDPAAELLRKMLAGGLSKFEPEPVAALAEKAAAAASA